MVNIFLSLIGSIIPVSVCYCQEILDTEEYEESIELEVYCYDDVIIKGPHRTPPKIPTVYYNRSANKLLFAEPMGDCIIELENMETEEVIFSIPVMYGVTQVQLPQLNSGQYLLNIMCGNYLFTGIIEN